jgi:tetratricopeptide (TPR) repeat protein/S1-C subfamily serine protease
VNQELEIDVYRVFRDARLPKHPTRSCCIKTLSTIRNLSINLALLLPHTFIVNKHLTLIPLCLIAIACAQAIPKPTATVSPQFQTVADKTISAESIETIARQITVQVHVGDRRGSGTMIAKRGNRYTILTNAHVANKSNSYRITTPDGKTYQAQCAQPLKQGTCTADKNHDLALLEFTSTQNYTVPTWGDSRSLKPGETVYSAGFPFEGRELKIDKSQVTQQTSKPLQGGYQIGYSGTTAQGMSGGSLLNSSGQLIGIIGFNSQPILNDGYQYQDGTQPLPDVVKEWRKSSFAIPIATLARLDRQYQAFLPSGSSTVAYTGVVKQVDDIAAQITVRIEDKNGGNGSGVIIAKDGDTYYVATARHVVRTNDGENIAVALSTPTQEQIPLKVEQINIPNAGLDIAIVKFNSKQNYRIAEVGNYQVQRGQWLFVSGFPGKDGKKQRHLTAGGASGKDAESDMQNPSNFKLNGQGYEMVYTNLSFPGMSGGAVLDQQGKLVGINTSAENGNSIEQINFGNSLGIPISTLIGVASQGQVGKLKISDLNTPPSELTSIEAEQVFAQLYNFQSPSQNATAKEWLDYGNILWRGLQSDRAIAAFDRAISLLNNSKIDQTERKEKLTIAYLGKGFTLGSQAKFQEALKEVKQASATDPNSYPAWRYQGIVSAKLGDYKEGLIAYQKAREILKDKEDNKFSSYIELVTNILLPLGETSEAIKLLNEAIRLRPNSAHPYLLRSMSYAYQKDYKQALEDSDRVISLDRNNPLVYQTRAIIYSGQKDYKQAIEYLTKAIAIDSKNGDNYQHRAGIYKLNNENPLALTDCNRAIELNPKNPYAYHIRAEIYRSLKDKNKALADFKEAIRLTNPVSSIDYINRSGIYSGIKEYQKAVEELTKAISISPNNEPAYVARGQIFVMQGKQTEALADFNQAINLNSNNAKSYLDRGQLLLTFKDRHQAALADFNKAIALKPNDVEAYPIRGNYFNSQGQYQLALNDFDRAININPNNAESYRKRGEFFNSQGRYQQALDDLNTAIAKNPKDSLAYADIGIVFQSRREYQKSLEYFNKAIEIDPDQEVFYVSRGNIFVVLKDKNEEALNDFDMAIKINDKAAAAYIGKGLVFKNKNQPEEAIDNFNIAIGIEQNQALPQLDIIRTTAYLQRGQIFQSQNQTQKAIDDFTKAISINDKNVEAYILRAKAFAFQKKYQAAVTDYNRAIELNDKNPVVYILRASAYAFQGKYQAAITDSDRAIALNDRNPEPYIIRGFANIKQKKYQEAYNDSERAIKLNELSNQLAVNDKASAYNNRGQVLLFLNKIDSAIADFNTAITLNNKPPRFYLNLGLAYKQKQDFNQAKVNFTKAVELFRAQNDRVGDREAIAELQKLTK